MFYVWLDRVYILLLCLALWSNRRDLKMLALTAVVGAGIFVPVAATKQPTIWYLQCLLVELVIVVLALRIKASASWVILLFCVLEAVAHVTAIALGPQPGFGPYRAIIPIIEIAKLLSCILLSRNVLTYFTKKALQ